MADGYITGTLREFGQVVHTDGTSTLVVGITLPSFDSIWKVLARCTGSSDSGSCGAVHLISFNVVIDGGTASIGAMSSLSNSGICDITIGTNVSGTNVGVLVTAFSGYRTVGVIEAFGVEMNIMA